VFSHPGRFTPGEEALCTHWIGGSMGTAAWVEAVAKRKNPLKDTSIYGRIMFKLSSQKWGVNVWIGLN
jgi:hypothetical protein